MQFQDTGHREPSQRKRSLVRWRKSISFLVVLLALACHSTRAMAQTTASYVGPTMGTWNVATNWDLGVVPLNSPPSEYNIIIPSSRTVTYDAPSGQVTAMVMGSGARMNVGAARSLEVLGVTSLNGTVSVSGIGAAFAAASPFAALGSLGRGYVSGGGVLVLGSGTYSYNLGSSNDLFTSDGAGSLLDLRSLTRLQNDDSNPAGVWYIRSSNGGVVDLSNVTTLRGSGMCCGANQDQRLSIEIQPNSDVRFGALTQATSAVRWVPRVPVYTLPSLATCSHGRFDAGPGVTLNLPALTATFHNQFVPTENATGFGTINAPLLSDFRNAFVRVTSRARLNSAPMTQIDGARLEVLNGGTLTSADRDYTWTDGIDGIGYAFDNATSGWLLFRAEGAGSFLDLSSLETMARVNDRFYATGWRIVAAGGGTIDLSGLRSISQSAVEDHLSIDRYSGGQIRFDALQSVHGGVTLWLQSGTWTFPSLQTCDGFSGYDNSVRFQVLGLARMEMPSLVATYDTSFELSDAGQFIAPALTTMRRCMVNLNQSRTLTTGSLTNVDNSRFVVSGPRTWAIAATSYVYSVGLTTSGVPGCFVAQGGATIDLPNLASFAVGSTGGTQAVVLASSGGVVNMPSLRTVTGTTSGYPTFRADADGTIRFGAVTFTSGRADIVANSPTSRLEAVDMHLRGVQNITLSNDGSLSLTNDWSFSTSSESQHNLRGGRILLIGNGTLQDPQKYEVGGTNIGTPTGTVSNNFELGQLVVGRNGLPTVAQLVDEWNNGNRGAGNAPESLYLQGFPSDDGLRVLDGSVLMLGDIDLYAVRGNQWIRVRSLFPPGVTCIPYDGGYVCLGSPGSCQGSPTLLAHPQSREECAGSTVAFSVDAIGGGTISYQWRRAGVPLVDSGTVSGAATPTLTISRVATFDVGNYDCQVSNACGTIISRFASLTVRGIEAIANPSYESTLAPWQIAGGFSFPNPCTGVVAHGGSCVAEYLAGDARYLYQQFAERNASEFVRASVWAKRRTPGVPATIRLSIADLGTPDVGEVFWPLTDTWAEYVLDHSNATIPAFVDVFAIEARDAAVNRYAAYIDDASLTLRCVADIDDGSAAGACDGGVTIDDLLYYLFVFEQGLPRADLDDGSSTGNPDGGVTIDDLLYYLFRFEAGC